MARALVALTVVLLATALVAAGCEGGAREESTATVPCDDAAFRAQDEELYVTQATIANAIGGGGDPATLLLDLRRARAALATYIDEHPPCEARLVEIAADEREAISALDEAIEALDAGGDPVPSLGRARAAVEAAQRRLADAP